MSREQIVNNFGPGAITAQNVGAINVYPDSSLTRRRIEHPEDFYIPHRRRSLPDHQEAESNIERKMEVFGTKRVKWAQKERANLLEQLERFSSLSEYSEEHLDYILRELELLYHQVYESQLEAAGAKIAFAALLDRLNEFAMQHTNRNRLPLNGSVVFGLLANATGICDIDWSL